MTLAACLVSLPCSATGAGAPPKSASISLDSGADTLRSGRSGTDGGSEDAGALAGDGTRCGRDDDDEGAGSERCDFGDAARFRFDAVFFFVCFGGGGGGVSSSSSSSCSSSSSGVSSTAREAPRRRLVRGCGASSSSAAALEARGGGGEAATGAAGSDAGGDADEEAAGVAAEVGVAERVDAAGGAVWIAYCSSGNRAFSAMQSSTYLNEKQRLVYCSSTPSSASLDASVIRSDVHLRLTSPPLSCRMSDDENKRGSATDRNRLAHA